jgi:dienelactone hydrolase
MKLKLAWYFAALVALVAAVRPGCAADVRVASTPDGIRYGLWGPQPSAPAPILFVFAGTIEGTLGDAYFRQSANQLAVRGFVAVSLDLPSHGQERRPGEPDGIAGWRARAERGEPFMEEFADKCRRVLDHLVAQRIADPTRVAASGTSRGGFAALQFAAREPRVRAVAAFAPVADFGRVKPEFAGAENAPGVVALRLDRQAAALAGRALWIIIGDRDSRVDTDATIAFARRVTAAGLEMKLDPRVELHVMPEPKGHTTPAGAAEQAAAWLERQVGR